MNKMELEPLDDMYKIKNVCCIGAGFVGGPTMAVFADRCPNIVFNVIDSNPIRINQWNNNLVH